MISSPVRSSSWKIAGFLVGIVFLSGVSCVNIQQNHESVEGSLGDEVDFVCFSDEPKVSCTISSPSGQTLTIIQGLKYENGRILPNLEDERSCGIKITKLEEADNGLWKCQVGVAQDDGNFVQGHGEMEVTVAVPPTSIELNVNGAPSDLNQLVVKLSNDTSTATLDVACVARQARPAPTFKWFIGDTRIQGETTDSLENEENGKADYTQTLTLYADPKHQGQELECVVEHPGYTEYQKEDEVNVIRRELELLFKPIPQEKAQTFYGLKEGHAETIRIKFQANPIPTIGFWRMDGQDTDVPLGAASLDKQFQSGVVEEAELPGEYTVSLTINDVKKEMAGKTNVLSLTNDYGTTEYEFTLVLGDKPPAEGFSQGGVADQKIGGKLSSSGGSADEESVEPLGTGPIIGVVVVVIIVVLLVAIAVVARAKGILCFAGKKRESESQQEGQEGDDTDNARQGEDVENGRPEAESSEANEAVSTPKKSAIGMKVSNLLNLFRKSMRAGKTKNNAPTDSEAKLHEDDKKDEGEITYADLDQNALGAPGPVPDKESEKTEYAEITPSK